MSRVVKPQPGHHNCSGSALVSRLSSKPQTDVIQTSLDSSINPQLGTTLTSRCWPRLTAASLHRPLGPSTAWRSQRTRLSTWSSPSSSASWSCSTMLETNTYWRERSQTFDTSLWGWTSTLLQGARKGSSSTNCWKILQIWNSCAILPQLGKLAKTNTLTISAQQQQLLGLREKLFGQASSNGPGDVYVTRDQMTDLASEMYSTLNIVEDYQIPEIQFSEAFVDGMINQIASSQFQQVPIDDVLASLSKFGFDIGEDLQPDVIKRDLGSILTIEKRDEKSRIILNESNYKNFEESRTGSGGGKAGGFFGISASAKWANGNSQKDTVDIRSLSDQLRELNTLSQRDIAWDVNGQMVVPKSLNVARLASSKLGRTISFSRIRIQSFLAPFDRLFAIYTNRAEAETSILDQLWARFNAFQVDLQEKNKTWLTRCDLLFECWPPPSRP